MPAAVIVSMLPAPTKIGLRPTETSSPVSRGGAPGSIVTTMSWTRPMRSPAGSLTGSRRSCEANIFTGGSPP